MKPLWLCGAAAAVGVAALGVWFSPQWIGTRWPLLSKDQITQKARALAQRFGAEPKDDPAWTASVSKPLAAYRRQHPDDKAALALSPLSVRLVFGSKETGRFTEVGLDSGGRPLYWHTPADNHAGKAKLSERDLAQEAFTSFAPGAAASGLEPSKSMGDDPQQERYLWKIPPAANSDLREQISVLIKDGQVDKVERKISFASTGGEGTDSDDDDDNDWIVFSIVFWILCTVFSAAAVGILIFWLVRKVVPFRFPLTVAGAVFTALLAAALARSNAGEAAASIVFSVLLLASFTAVGRGVSEEARLQWMPLEQLCLLAPVSRRTGESLLAGVLCSPLLVAIPFAITGSPLFPHSFATLQNLEIFYSRVPFLEGLGMNLGRLTYTLAFFGFGVPALRRMIKPRWLRWTIVLPLGIVFFANLLRVVDGPIPAPLTAGFFTLAVLGFLFRSFDLLAVLAAQLAGGFVLSLWEFTHKAGTWWPFALGLAVLLGLGLWFARYGSESAAGDPAGVVPGIHFFRAERERLQAEFLVAKRAQEGMLPQRSPKLAGYSIAASCTPSLDVGGDLYDFLELPDGRLGIAVADVSGKGVPAALYMTLTKGLLNSVSRDCADLGGVMEEVNLHLHGVTRRKVFVTMALGVLDGERRSLECVRAGHNPVVWRQARANVTKLVAPSGLGLGITAGRIFKNQLRVERMDLQEGDAVVFYSDGITEAMNNGLEQFGEERLMSAVAAADHMDAAGAHDAILTAVLEFLDGVRPQDDMTLVVLRVG